MFCTYCGSEIQATGRFCAQCGKASTPPQSEFRRPSGTSRLALDIANKKIAGVCAGIAAYLGWDVTLIRVLFLAGLILSGASLAVYLIFWIAMPRNDMPAYAG